jgi:hypothetical protein
LLTVLLARKSLRFILSVKFLKFFWKVPYYSLLVSKFLKFY